MTVSENNEMSDYFLLKTKRLLRKIIDEQKQAEKQSLRIKHSYNECRMLVDKTHGLVASKNRSLWLKKQSLYSIPEDFAGQENRVPPLHGEEADVLPQRVKVTLHTNTPKPYLVVFTNKKVGKPVLYVKLSQCKLVKVNENEIKLIKNENGSESSNDSSEIAHLESSRTDIIAKWHKQLSSATTKSNNLHKLINKRCLRSLPALQEEREDQEQDSSSTNLKSPVRKISRVARKNSFSKKYPIGIL